VGELGAQRAGQVVLDVADRHPTRIQRDDHLVEAAAEAAGPLGHQPRLERRRAVPRHVQPDRADLGQHRLRGAPVAGVRRPPTGRVALVVAEVITELDRQAPLEHGLDQFREEPSLPGQPQPGGVDLAQQPLHQLVIDQLPRRHRRRARGHTPPRRLVLPARARRHRRRDHGHRCSLSRRGVTSVASVSWAPHLHRPFDTLERVGARGDLANPYHPRPGGVGDLGLLIA
jgi:hypothetical protein